MRGGDVTEAEQSLRMAISAQLTKFSCLPSPIPHPVESQPQLFPVRDIETIYNESFCHAIVYIEDLT